MIRSSAVTNRIYFPLKRPIFLHACATCSELASTASNAHIGLNRRKTFFCFRTDLFTFMRTQNTTKISTLWQPQRGTNRFFFSPIESRYKALSKLSRKLVGMTQSDYPNHQSKLQYRRILPTGGSVVYQPNHSPDPQSQGPRTEIII